MTRFLKRRSDAISLALFALSLCSAVIAVARAPTSYCQVASASDLERRGGTSGGGAYNLVYDPDKCDNYCHNSGEGSFICDGLGPALNAGTWSFQSVAMQCTPEYVYNTNGCVGAGMPVGNCNIFTPNYLDP